MRHALLCAIVLSLFACGGAPPHDHSREALEALRRAAEDRPNDPDAQMRWAEGELFMQGGDGEKAEQATARALALLPDDPRARFLRATERDLHGEAEEALREYLETVVRAATSSDSLRSTLAEVALAHVTDFDDGVSGYGDSLRERLAPLLDAPTALGPAPRHIIASLLIELAYRRGDMNEVARLAGQAGCATEYRVIGPFGPRQLLGFDQELAPERDERLGSQYDLGPGRGTRAVRELMTRGCTLHLGNGPVTGGGTTYAETQITVPSERDFVVRLESPNSVQLLVDGEEVTRLDRRAEVIARVTFHPIHLSAGDHLVRVKTTSRHANPVLVLSITPESSDEAEPSESSPLEQVLRASRFASRADYPRARQTLLSLAEGGETPTAVLDLLAIVTLSDWLLGTQVASDEARRLLVDAADRDMRAWFPRLQLARLESDELTRIEMLRRAVETWPKMLVLPLSLIDALEGRRWEADIDQTIGKARAIAPDACRPKRAALNSALRRARSAEVSALAEELVACDARSDARLQHAVRSRDWEGAQREVVRMAALEPASAKFTRLDAELTLARHREDEAEVTRLLREIGELQPRSESVVRLESDRLWAAGREREARQRIEAALREEPQAMATLRRPLSALGGEDPLESHRQDGLRVIREFEASGRTYDGPKALVLDYTVVRVFEDGSTLTLTHNIIRVQSEEAVDQEGEFTLPENAELLTLRTIKADGSRLEPDEIQGKDTLSLPNLAVGDYVEFEHVTPEPAPSGFPGGVLGDRFYFQSFEVPYDRSELTVITPEAMRPVIDPRGSAPEVRESVEQGLRVLRFTVRESRPRQLEPASVSAREYLPSVDWGVNATWDAYLESLRDALADRNVRDPSHRALLGRILEGSGNDPLARARAIHHWVIENIEDSNDPFGQAATMVHARTGNRARVLSYLLNLADIPSELALARSFSHDMTTSELADEETYSFLVVRMHGPEGPIWLWPGARGAAFGYLPNEPAIRGQAALVLNASGERTTLSEPPSGSDGVRIEADVSFEERRARVSVREHFRGALAVAWRNQLESVPAAQLEDVFARQYVAQLAPGARMRSLRVDGRDSPEEELVLEYAFDADEFGRIERGVQHVPQLFPTMMTANFARVSERTTTQFFTGGNREITLRVHLPDSSGRPSLPATVDLRGPHGMEAHWSAKLEDDVVVIERTLSAPRMRISPEEYREFAAFCRRVDEAEEAEIRVGN